MNRQPQPPPPSTARARCAGCRAYFSAAQGVAELPCPNCQMPHVFFVDSSAVKIRCSSCKAVVNAPSNLSKFPCPQCHVRIDVHADVEEVNEVLCFHYFVFYCSWYFDLIFRLGESYGVKVVLIREWFCIVYVTLIWLVAVELTDEYVLFGS